MTNILTNGAVDSRLDDVIRVMCVFPFDTLVSRLHASLEITPDGEIWLVDEKSRNGTFIGREKVTVPHEIEQEHLFKIGKTLVRLQNLRIAEGV